VNVFNAIREECNKRIKKNIDTNTIILALELIEDKYYDMKRIVELLATESYYDNIIGKMIIDSKEYKKAYNNRNEVGQRLLDELYSYCDKYNIHI